MADAAPESRRGPGELRLSSWREGPVRILFDPERVSAPGPRLFDPAVWADEDRIVGRMTGRGPTYVVAWGDEEWVLRHYRRGGFVRHFSRDRYVWTGRRRARPLRELRWLAKLRRAGLPVPPPVAALVRREGPWYRGDILTVRVPGTPLGEFLREGRTEPEAWFRVGACIRGFHDRDIHHADLNVDNVLVSDEEVHLIDFDRVRGWRMPRLGDPLRRLLRSAAGTVGPGWEEDPEWERCRERLREGYRTGGAGA